MNDVGILVFDSSDQSIIQAMVSTSSNLSPERALLIFNPSSGVTTSSPIQLMQVITAMQSNQITPEVVLIQPGVDLSEIIARSLRRGIRLFVASGGDGTVNSTAASLVGSRAQLGIIPTGTRNNVALSLGIPADIQAAVALLANGRRLKVDIGVVENEKGRRVFLESCTLGLLSALFPSADDIQHGNLAAIGDFLATLFSTPPTQMHLKINNRHEIDTQGHVIIISNMPYFGPNYKIAAKNSFVDGVLDVLVFANLTKLELLGTVVQRPDIALEDPRIHHYRVKSVEASTLPPMPVTVDGLSMGNGPLRITIQRRALTVITGSLPDIP